MAIEYTKQSYGQIEDKLRKIINDYFGGVYISSQYIEQKQVESIRITLNSIDVLQQTNGYEFLKFNVMIRHYLKEPHSIKREEYAKNRIDRLKKLLWDNITTTTTNYTSLAVDSIEFNIQDSENEDNENLQITELNISMNRLNIFSN